jgi:uncharacterized protein YbjT (DUF2867 family)
MFLEPVRADRGSCLRAGRRSRRATGEETGLLIAGILRNANLVAPEGSPRIGRVMILVIGGRSKIGSAVLDQLGRRGASVRTLARSSEPSAAFPPPIETVTGNLGDPASLAAAMQGVEQVFLLCGPTPDEVALNRNAIDAAHTSGVRLVVRISILAADPASTATFVRNHGQSDAYLARSGLAHAILRPNSFAQNVPETVIPTIDSDGRFYANVGDARLSMVDTADVGAVAAVVLTSPGHDGKTYDVTGPEALSFGDVASKLSSRLGRRVEYVDVPDAEVRSALAGAGLGDWLVDSLVSLFAQYRRSGTDGYAAQVTDTVLRLTGKTAHTLDDVLTTALDSSP